MRLTSEQAGEMLAAAVTAAPRFERTPVNVVNRAIDNLRNEYKELLSVLDEREWAERVAAFCRLNIPIEHGHAVASDVFAAGVWIETALLTLIDSGVLKPVIVTPEVEADLVAL